MPVVGDVLEFKDFQTLSNVGGDVLNVYHWRVDTITSAIGLTLLGDYLAEWFYTGFLPTILALQSNAVIHTRLEINNLMAYETDFWVGTPASPVTGSVPGEYLSSTTAWSFQYVRQLRTTRNGSKRIGGVAESLAANNQPAAGTAALLNAAASIMGSDPTVEYPTDQNIQFSPVIVRKAADVSLPPLAVNPVTSVIWRGLGTQNTRKQLL